MNTTKKVLKYVFTAVALCLAFSILCAIMWGVNFLFYFAGAPTGTATLPEYTQTFEDITSLRLKNGAGRLQIQEGDGFSVAAADVSDEFVCQNQNGTLVVENPFTVQFWDFGGSDSEITVTIPRGFSLDSVYLECGAGAIDISALSCNTLEITAGAGRFEGRNLNAQQAVIYGGVGQFTVNNAAFGNLELECGIGQTELVNADIQSGHVESGIGKTSIALAGRQSEYSLKVETGLGNVEIAGETAKNGTYGTGARYLTVNGGIGKVEITFAPSASI